MKKISQYIGVESCCLLFTPKRLLQNEKFAAVAFSDAARSRRRIISLRDLKSE
jgi:hypothetical protein